MDCYIGSGMLLLAIIAALFFLLRCEKENGKAILKWIAWLCILFALLGLLCLGYNCWHSGCCFNGAGCSKGIMEMSECGWGKSCCAKGEMMCHDEDATQGMHCCEEDSGEIEKTFVNKNGDTVRLQKHIKIIK